MVTSLLSSRLMLVNVCYHILMSHLSMESILCSEQVKKKLCQSYLSRGTTNNEICQPILPGWSCLFFVDSSFGLFSRLQGLLPFQGQNYWGCWLGKKYQNSYQSLTAEHTSRTSLIQSALGRSLPILLVSRCSNAGILDHASSSCILFIPT